MMTLWIFIISTLAVVFCRPSVPSSAASPSVEIEKQQLIEIHPQARQIIPQDPKEEETKQILEKIAQVNEQQGLNKKKPKPFRYFPPSYLRNEDSREFQLPFNNNPIFDYLGQMQNGGKISEDEEVPDGHYIKRKITHQQTVLIPGYSPMQQTVDNIKNIVESTQYYQPSPLQNFYQFYPQSKQSWQWPLGQYFPIVIRDPFIHMMNALTTMVEYGPSSSSDSCKKPKDSSREQKKLSYSISNNGKGPEISISNNDDSSLPTLVDIEDLSIGDSRESKQTSRQSPPIRDQPIYEDEVDSDEEAEKAEDVNITHEGNKKLISKDNTGSGIFVHKIKVRKGGVAIAGPGGIATAGSGGTAIVGPNGFAYTQPDSLAIAGSGTKVIAVEPNINLTEVIMNHNTNKTRGDGKLPPRVGKIVAVGPVVYYNKG